MNEPARQVVETLFLRILPLSWVLLMCAGTAGAQPYDLIFRHGQILDGTGAAAFVGDVAIKEGHIAAVGEVNGSAAKEIDITGLVIAPGFIDVHTHSEDIEQLPEAENFLRMGVTTLVMGNCGGSRPHLDVLFSNLAEEKISANVASLIGHNEVRRLGMNGSFNRPPTDAEMAKMKGLVDQAMKDGAVGFSTGLEYLPGTFAKTEEIIELAKVAASYGGIYTTHMRDEGNGISNSVQEAIRIAREAKIRAEVSHIKLIGPSNWGHAADILAMIEKARAEGLDITQDAYAYTASSTGIGILIPHTALEGARGAFTNRLADPAQKKAIVDAMKEMLRERGSPDYSYAVIASYRRDSSLNGLSVKEAAKKLRGSDSLDDQIETVLEIQSHGGAQGVFHSMSEEDLKTFLRQTNTMIACDSGVRSLGEGVPHPRGYGNNARVLGLYTRDQKVLTLPDAIRKMTSLPAQTFKFKGRGELRPGNWADLVVFDPATIQDHATYADPHHYSTGFKYVFVNGTAVVEDDKHTGARPGMILRRETETSK